MNILKSIKNYLFPVQEFRMSDVDNYIRDNFFLATIDLICKSNKLTDIEKRNLISKLTYNCSHDRFIDKNGYEYFKKTLG